jgi:hypothetical protein
MEVSRMSPYVGPKRFRRKPLSVGPRRDRRRTSVGTKEPPIQWLRSSPAIQEYSVGAWKYKRKLIPYVGIRKGSRIVKAYRLDKVARPLIIAGIVTFLGPLGIPSAKATQLANYAYDLASSA